MRKEIRRSLLLWPIAASATITAASWVGMDLVQRNDAASLVAKSPRPITFADTNRLVSSRIDRETANSAEAQERDQHGSRGIGLPERVATVFGQGQRLPLMAPVRATRHELAGLALQFDREGVFRSQVSAAQGDPSSARADEANLADAACLVSEMPLNTRTLQSLRNRSRVVSTLGSARHAIVVDEAAIAMIAPLIAEGISDLRPAVPNEFVLTPSVRSSSLPLSNRVLAKPARIDLPVAKSLSLGGARSAESYVTDMPVVDPSDINHAEGKRTGEEWPGGWPVTSQLDVQLNQLTQMTTSVEIATWCNRVASSLVDLRRLPRLGDERGGAILDRLTRLAQDGEVSAEKHSIRDQQVAWLRAVHALHRRVEVWNPIWQVTRSRQSTWMVTDEISSSVSTTRSADDVALAVQSVRRELDATGDPAGWTSFLLLDEIHAATTSNSGDAAEREERSLVAQRLLSRLSWHALQESHLEWLEARKCAAIVGRHPAMGSRGSGLR